MHDVKAVVEYFPEEHMMHEDAIVGSMAKS